VAGLLRCVGRTALLVLVGALWAGHALANTAVYDGLYAHASSDHDSDGEISFHWDSGATHSLPLNHQDQVVGWDAQGGAGLHESIDLSGSRDRHGDPEDRGVDALAANRDSRLLPLIGGLTDLLFSVAGAPGSVTSGPLATSGGATIGGSGDISFEQTRTGAGGVWARGSTHIDSTTPPVDVDGLELPGAWPSLSGNALLYSHADDSETSTSIWLHDTGQSQPYVSHALIVEAVLSVLGLPVGFITQDLIDLDALVALDVFDPYDFGNGDILLFSIGQIPDPEDPDGFYATGSELILAVGWRGGVLATPLLHGGHQWDHAWTLEHMRAQATGELLDVNAIEVRPAHGPSPIPEPAPGHLLLAGLFALRLRGRAT
jgi:hypothetical protein